MTIFFFTSMKKGIYHFEIDGRNFIMPILTDKISFWKKIKTIMLILYDSNRNLIFFHKYIL